MNTTLIPLIIEQAKTEVYTLPDDQKYFSTGRRIADESIRRRILGERAMIRWLCLAAISKDPTWFVGVNDGEDTTVAGSRDIDEIMAAVMTTEGDVIMIRRNNLLAYPDGSKKTTWTRVATFWTVYGNMASEVFNNWGDNEAGNDLYLEVKPLGDDLDKAGI